MQNYLTYNDLEALALGAGLLGSGGGGNPRYDMLSAHHALSQYGPVKLITLADIQPDDLIVPVAYMGAPLISIERLPNGSEFDTILDLISKYYGQKSCVIMPVEIGGANAFTPLSVAAKRGLPVLDADLLGRAFPQLEMCSTAIAGIAATPAFIVDAMGNSTVITTRDSKTLERIARAVTVSMGSSAAIAAYIMTGAQVACSVIPVTLTQALHLGKIILQARAEHRSPIEALKQHTDGIVIAQGSITDITQEIKDGFLRGSVTITSANTKTVIEYQNENIVAYVNTHLRAISPDIIIPVDTQTGEPITTESLAYGIDVSVLVLPAPAFWTTPAGLAVVGPACFGYNTTYRPAKELL